MTISKRTSYQKVKAAIAEPTEQVAILLEYTAKEVIKAEADLDKNKFESFFIHIDKALSVLNGLAAILNDQEKVSGEVGEFINDMTTFYAGLIMKLSRLTKENYKQVCPVIISDAQGMAKVWREAKSENKEQATKTSIRSSKQQTSENYEMVY